MRSRGIALVLFLSLLTFSVSFGDEGMRGIVREKNDAWNCAMDKLEYSSNKLEPFFRLKEYWEIVDLGLPAIPALVELNEKDPFLSVAIKTITKRRLREKYVSGRKTFPDFPEIPIPLYATSYWWSKIRPNGRTHFGRFYADWKEAKRTEAEDLPEKFKNVACLGVDVLPFLVEKISQGDTELTELVSYLTDGEVRASTTPEECKSWWKENHAKWTIPSN